MNRYILMIWVCFAGGVQASQPPVTVTQDEHSFTLDNGLVTARVDKENGRLTSLKYNGVQMLGNGYWSWAGRLTNGPLRSASVRIDPATNRGERVEVSCVSGNTQPGSNATPLTMDVRYSLGRGEHWLYAYAVWTHEPGCPPFGLGEARYCVKLNPSVFDYMTIDANRRRQMPTPEDWEKGQRTNLKEARLMTTGIHKGEVEHKYDYSAVLSETPAYGWSSTKDHVGLWMINPSMEYMSGGPAKAELTGHLDVNPGAVPVLLNMWLGSHYGGSSFSVGTNESWQKCIGPFVLYCNAAKTHEKMWKDALTHAEKEKNAWPYKWVSDPTYPQAAQRATAKGRIVFNDPFAPKQVVSNMLVGLTAPDYAPAFSRNGPWGPPGKRGDRPFRDRPPGDRPFPTNRPPPFAGFPTNVDWQRDAKYYQFWTRADSKGRFKISNVRPGVYTLHAIADGVLGELTLTNITVTASNTLDLGKIAWTPVRYGRTLWEIGVPDRTAREFRHGDDYWHWGLYYQYPKEFPNDVHFVIGQSDWRRDWNYDQPPRTQMPEFTTTNEEEEEAQFEQAFESEEKPAGPSVQSTTWTVAFKGVPSPHGKAMLRLAFCGTHAGCNVEVSVNGTPIGSTGPLPPTSTMQRDGIRAYWVEKDLPFDAALLTSGNNTIALHSPAKSWGQGVMYDYLRLELEE